MCFATIMYACRLEKGKCRGNSVHYRTMLCGTLKKTINSPIKKPRCGEYC